MAGGVPGIGLTDYSGAAGAGAAFQGFASALQTAQDRALMRQEQQAKINAMQTSMQREKDATDLEAMKTGAVRGPGGGFQQGAATPEMKFNMMSKMASEGEEATGTDDLGFPTGVKYNPLSTKGVHETNLANKYSGQMALAQTAQDQRERRLQLQQQRMDVNSDFKAASQYGNEMGDTENQLLQGQKALGIINTLKTQNPNDPNAIKSSKQLSGDLSASLASMLNQGKPATVFGMQQQEFDSAWGRIQHALQFTSGNTRNSITPDMLNQLGIDINAVKGEIGKQHQIKYDSLKSSLPPQYTGGIDQRFHTFRQGIGLEAPPQQQAPAGAATGIVDPGLVRGGPGLVTGAAQAPGLAPHEMTELEKLRAKKAAAGAR